MPTKTNKLAKRGKHVTIEEALSMRADEMSGMTRQDIGKKYSRSPKAVIRALNNISDHLDLYPAQKDKLLQKVEERQQQLVDRAYTIVEKADGIIEERITDDAVTAKDASDIADKLQRRIYMHNNKKSDEGDDFDPNARPSAKVINIINRITNHNHYGDNHDSPIEGTVVEPQ